VSELISQYLDAASLSDDRAAAYRRLFGEIELALGPMPVDDIAGLARLLDGKQAAGFSPSTRRKNISMVKAIYRWLYDNGRVSADTLLAVRAIKQPPGSSRGTQPEPYRRKEIKALWTKLDERWPTLPDDQAWHWINRWREGRSPYSRIRSHAIHHQLAAVLALALNCGLRRAEIFRLDEIFMHDNNAGVTVFDEVGPPNGKWHEVPYTVSARELIAPWVRIRKAINPDHGRAWLSLWSAPTVREPMSRESFNTLLPTYLGPWQFSRLRATCGVGWAKAGLPPEHLRRVLGYSSVREVMPFLGLVGGDLEGWMRRLDVKFQPQIGRVA
jgi:integrase